MMSKTKAPLSGRVKSKQKRSGQIEPYLYLLPIFLLYGVFMYYPIARTINMSFSIVNAMGEIVKFCGLRNYRELLTGPSEFWSNLKSTVILTAIVVPLEIIIGMFLAILAENRDSKKKSPLRLVYAFPMAVSSSCASIIWLMMFNPSTGIINFIIGKNVNWFGDGKLAILMIVITTTWMGIGMNFLYSFSGVQGVPSELYESASVEGASVFQKVKYITLPCVTPTLFFLLVTNTIATFQTFAQIHIMTQGGPADSTRVLAYSIYSEAFMNNRWGYACAQSIIMMIILMIVSFIQFRFEKRGVYYS